MGIPGPNLPSAGLTDVGKGRRPRARRVVVVEHLESGDWREIGRFGSTREAAVALDESVADGWKLEELRERELGPSTVAHVAWGIVAALLILAFAFAMYVLFS